MNAGGAEVRRFTPKLLLEQALPDLQREVLRPETDWEGANLPIKTSRSGHIDVPVNQLRDPTIYQEKGETYLLYSVAGEGGIAVARIKFK